MKLSLEDLFTIDIESGKFNTITFKDTLMLEDYLYKIDTLNNKTNRNNNLVTILDREFQEFNKSDFHFIQFDCRQLINSNQKELKENWIKILEDKINNDEDTHEIYHSFKVALDNLYSKLSITLDGLTVDLIEPSNALWVLLKQAMLDIHIDTKDVSQIELRKLYFKILESMNIKGKESIMILYYPEVNIGTNELEEFLDWLESLKITVICLTNSLNVISRASPLNLHLVVESGKRYDLKELKEDIELFQFVDKDDINKVTVYLAYHDFTKQKFILNKEWQKFLDSNKYC